MTAGAKLLEEKTIMSRRAFILLILVVLVLVLVVLLFFALQTGGGLLGSLTNDNGELPPITIVEGVNDDEDAPDDIPAEPIAQATPVLTLSPVMVADVELPPGTRITADLLRVENRPSNNIAVTGGYTFSEAEELVGSVVKVRVPQGEAILRPMIAVNTNDLANMGSDLGLYIDQGNVTIAFPIDRYSGVAFALRPGDIVDVLMTARIVRTDSEFRSQLPNITQRVIQSRLLEGQQFLFPEIPQGRLQFIDEIGQTAEIIPSTIALEEQDFEAGDPIPKRATQLTIQQAKVMWVGTWPDPAAEDAAGPEAAPTPLPIRLIERPDVVLLSMPLQDALILKWAMERGVFINLALRAPNDRDVYNTTAVSLPVIVEQGALAEPGPSEFDFHPRADEVPIPGLPPVEGDQFGP
jgi:Flp pilus assembly protein CpaB